MTIEEAIRELKDDRALYDSDVWYAGDGSDEGNLIQALDRAIEALEKQIPKQIEVAKVMGDCTIADCPACDGSILRVKGGPVNEYCPSCGQKVRWS